MSGFAYCQCFFTKNIFVPKLRAHVTFTDREQFRRDYERFFAEKSEHEFEEVLKQVHSEIQRRRDFREKTTERKEILRKSYKFLHPDLLEFNENFLHADFRRIIRNFRSISNYLDEFKQQYAVCDKSYQVYQFPVFTDNFCDKLIEECDNFNKTPNIPKCRPNTMNNYGILLDELGFTPFFDELRMNYLNFMSSLLFPDWANDSLDSHRAFTVDYEMGADEQLAYHFDNAEVTLNVALNPESEYEGGQIFFDGLPGEPEHQITCTTLNHKRTYGILHRGRQRHGALRLERGRRRNLIVWMRSSRKRAQCCPMCLSTNPILASSPSGDYGDGFKSTSNPERQTNVCHVT